MNIKNTGALTLALVAAFALSPVAAFADHHYGHDNGNPRNQWKAHKRAMKQARKQYSWSQERGMYRNSWGRASAAQRRQYDAQLAAQWRAYHHNNWRGTPNWNNYNDPAFLDYVHTSNPSLLTSLRTMFNF